MLVGRVRFKSAALGCAAAMTGLMHTGPAAALDGEWTAGGVAGAVLSTRVPLSPLLGVRAGYGLGSALDVQLEVSAGLLRRAETQPVLLRAFPSLVYKFDVVRWIPYVSAGAGPYLLSDSDAQLGLALGGGAGVDYLVDRGFSLGLGYQAQWLLGQELAQPLHQLTLAATWRSGW